VEQKGMPERRMVKNLLEKKLIDLINTHNIPDSLTFAGNGEPTLHPNFNEIIDDTINLRNHYFPKAKISVLSNATQINKPEILSALLKIENRILKLDAGSNEMFQRINHPSSAITLQDIITGLLSFKGNVTIQTLFLRGNISGLPIDNTTEKEINLWLEHLKIINPERVMIYPIARNTPLDNIEIISKEELNQIGRKVQSLGIETEIY
jgi:wyosine [tRNA(Phe)-imidazoG37] synthetase (radical SAM superfamily)